MNKAVDKFIERITKQMVIPLGESLENDDIEKIANNFKGILETSIRKYVPHTKIKTNKIMLSGQTLSLQGESKRFQRKIFRLNPRTCN